MKILLIMMYTLTMLTLLACEQPVHDPDPKVSLAITP